MRRDSRNVSQFSILSVQSEAVTIAAADGNIQYVSPAVQRSLGYSPEQVIMGHCKELKSRLDEVSEPARRSTEQILGAAEEGRFAD